MKPTWKSSNYLLAAVFAILFSGLGVLLAMLMMMTVDAAIEGDLRNMLIYLGLTVALAFMEFIIGVVFRYFTLRYTRGALEKSKNALYSNMLKGPVSDSEDNIAMYSTNTDIVYNNYYANKVLIVLVGSQFVFSVIGVIYLNWILFLVSFFVSLLPIFAPVIYQKRLGATIEKYSKASKAYIDYVQDSAKGVYDIKSFFAQSFFEKGHGELNTAVEKTRANNRMLNFLMERTSNLLGSFSFIAIIGVGGLLVIRGQMTIGVMIAVIQLLNGMVSPIGTFFTFIGEMTSSKELASSYFKQAPDDKGIAPPAFTGSITLEGVSYSYPQSKDDVLSNVSMQFEKGCAYAITGTSGCGKTTLSKIIAGLMDVQKGKVLYDGIEVKDIDKSLYMSKVRYIDQSAHLFDMSVRDNIEMGNSTGKYKEFLENLRMADIEGDTGIDALSGGQKQRSVIARALNRLPSVLILDEPTANLDVDTAISVIKYLQKFEGLTLIVVTHSDNTEMLGLFDSVVRM